MKNIIRFLATGCYSGYFPRMPGTAGSMAAAAICVFYSFSWWQILLLCMLGIPICTRGEKILRGNDPPQVVYDEFCGMFIAAWQITGPLQILLAFILFRFFDIMKPYPINKLQELPVGWGVMADDLAAGIAARTIVALISLIIKLF